MQCLIVWFHHIVLWFETRQRERRRSEARQTEKAATMVEISTSPPDKDADLAATAEF